LPTGCPNRGVLLLVVARTASANDALVHAFIEGILLLGGNVIDCGEGDEQAVIGAIKDNQASGGAHINHDDLQNVEVIALYDATGATITSDTGLGEISELVESGNFLPAATKGQITTL
jgi:hypothetical protein